MLLDRFGPRRVEAGLLLLAASGAAVFALSNTLGGLATGRALIGLGVSACLMASFKAFSQWFPPERQASLTGWTMASGCLGALPASKPLTLASALPSIGLPSRSRWHPEVGSAAPPSIGRGRDTRHHRVHASEVAVTV